MKINSTYAFRTVSALSADKPAGPGLFGVPSVTGRPRRYGQVATFQAPPPSRLTPAMRLAAIHGRRARTPRHLAGRRGRLRAPLRRSGAVEFTLAMEGN